MTDKYATLLNQTACYSAVSICFCLAKETGLFASLLAADKPLTSDEIANENKMKERYAREMLGCLTAIELAKVSKNEDGHNVYHLEEAAKTALNEGEFSLAEMNYPRLFMSRYDSVKDCLGADKSGMVRYQQSFIDLIDDHKRKLAAPTVDCLLKNIPDLRKNLERGIDVIEFGCGNAYHLSALATMFPKSNFVATEVNPAFLEPLKKRYGDISNLKYDVVDLCAIPEKVDKKYDMVYVNDVLHDLPHPGQSLKGIRKFLKEPDAICAIIDMAGNGSHQKDVGDMFAAFKYASSSFVCIPESFQSPDSEAHGAGMGKETMLGFFKDAGFDTTCIRNGAKSAVYIARLAKVL